MSLYNVVYGMNQATWTLLPMLGMSHKDIPRFRDCFIEDEEDKSTARSTGDRFLYVYTRTGGNNRESFAKEIERLRSHPNYILDKDDNFDNTYCTFKFGIPKEYKKDYDLIVNGDPTKVSDEYKKKVFEIYSYLGKELKLLGTHFDWDPNTEKVLTLDE